MYSVGPHVPPPPPPPPPAAAASSVGRSSSAAAPASGTPTGGIGGGGGGGGRWMRHPTDFSQRYKEAQATAKRKAFRNEAQVNEAADRELVKLQKQIEDQVKKSDKANRESNATLLPVTAAPCAVLREAVVIDIHKTHSYRQAPCYLLFLAFVTITTFIQLFADQRDAFYTIESVGVHMQREAFVKAATWEAWWDWLESAAVAMEKHVPVSPQAHAQQGPGLPLGFLHVRQWRVAGAPCKRPGGLSRAAQARLGNETCYPMWSHSAASQEPFGLRADHPFRPFQHNDFSLEGNDVEGDVTTYGGMETFGSLLRFRRDLFNNAVPNGTANVNDVAIDKYVNYVWEPTYLNYSARLLSTIDVAAQVRVLRRDGFVDSGTSAVSVEVIGYMSSREQFFETAYLAEAKNAGSLLRSHREKLFRSYVWDGDRSRFSFLVDLLTFFYIIWFAYVFLWEACFDLRVAKSPADLVRFWRLVDAAFLVVWCVTFYYRLSLWGEASILGEEGYTRARVRNYGHDEIAEDKFMVSYLRTLVRLYDGGLVWSGWGMLLAWLRILRYLSLSERMGLVTRSMSRMAPEFAAISVMFMGVLVGFSTSGVLTYSSDFKSFRDLQASLYLNFRLIFTQEMTCKRGGSCVSVDEMEKTDMIMTTFYVNILMILGFIVFLNVMVALVIGHLAQAQAASRNKAMYSWSPQAIWRELQRASGRFVPQWVTRQFEPISVEMDSRAKAVTGGAVEDWRELEPGDGLLVRATASRGAWEPATVHEVFDNGRGERPTVAVQLSAAVSASYPLRAGGRDTQMLEEFEEVHREVPRGRGRGLQAVGGETSLEDLCVDLVSMLDLRAPGEAMKKGAWIAATREHLPPARAVKIYDLALYVNTQSQAAEEGERFAEILVERVKAMEDALAGRDKHVRMIGKIAETDLVGMTKGLAPLARHMIPHFAEVSHDLKSLREGMVADFDEVSAAYGNWMGQVVDYQVRVAEKLKGRRQQLQQLQ